MAGMGVGNEKAIVGAKVGSLYPGCESLTQAGFLEEGKLAQRAHILHQPDPRLAILDTAIS